MSKKLFKEKLKYIILDSELYDIVRHLIIFYNRIKKKFINKDVSIIKKYWQNPSDEGNKPQQYTGEGYSTSSSDNLRTENLVKIINKLGIKNPSILEVGCNVGRNLNGLRKAGYEKLHAIEINDNAINLMKNFFPETYKLTKISIGPAQEVLKKFSNKQFDVVYSMAVLQHIPDEDISVVINEISRISKAYLISYETETYSSWKHFPRSYKILYKKFNFKYLYRKQGARVFIK